VALERLRERFADRLVNALAERLESGVSPQIEAEEFAAALGGQYTGAEITRFLDAAAAEGAIVAADVTWCPDRLHILDADDLRNGRCASCDNDFSETGDEPVPGRVYRIEGELSRDMDWLIAIHGFNTRGPWQEEFSWRIANKLRYSAPVLIYKYGRVRPGVLFRWRHRQLARELGLRLRAAIAFAGAHGHDDPPNLVIHSFGSQLFVTLLDLPDFRSLRFGRVIAAGSVIRPDYDWSSRIGEGRLEAIMNHCGGRDGAVPWAHYTIPGTGPSGRLGFSDPRAINLYDPDYSHSSCFGPDALAANLGDDGVWDRFLRRPLDRFADARGFDPATVQWRPRPVLRLAARAGIMGLFAAVAAALLLAVAAGLRCAAEMAGLA
jgi:hypothetical protein